MAKKQEKKPIKKKIKTPKIDKKGILETVPPPIPYSQDIPVYDVLEDYDINTDSGLSGCLYD